VAGDGTQGYKGDGGLATSAGLHTPVGVAVDASGNIYIADRYDNRIRMVTKSTGIITTVAGDGTDGYTGDGGLATSARLYYPSDVALDASGNIYIADSANHRIRMVTKSTGIITTVAGDGQYGYTGDGGLATSAVMNFPIDIALDASGNIFIADFYDHRIRMVTKSTGIITTVAGDGTGGYTGDYGPATSAGLNNPSGVAVDASGNIYIADYYNHRIRMVTKSDGIITTVAGDGTKGYKGDGGLATSARLDFPQGVVVDASGNIYIADSFNHRIRMVTKSDGIITTVAGGGTQGYKGDGGLATSAHLYVPQGVIVDASGNIYIADSANSRVRLVKPQASTPPPTLSSTVLNTSPTPSPTRSPTVPNISPTPSPTRSPTVLKICPTPSPTRSPTVLNTCPTIVIAPPTIPPTRPPTSPPSLPSPPPSLPIGKTPSS
jgi:trimeric autotransporter adhesin